VHFGKSKIFVAIYREFCGILSVTDSWRNRVRLSIDLQYLLPSLLTILELKRQTSFKQHRNDVVNLALGFVQITVNNGLDKAKYSNCSFCARRRKQSQQRRSEGRCIWLRKGIAHCRHTYFVILIYYSKTNTARNTSKLLSCVCRCVQLHLWRYVTRNVQCYLSPIRLTVCVSNVTGSSSVQTRTFYYHSQSEIMLITF